MGAWIPIPGALRRWREFRRMTQRQLSAATGRAGVKERTIRKMESNDPQETAEDDTIRGLAKALCDREKQIVCHPEFLARWLNSNGTFDVFDVSDPTLAPAPPPAVAANTGSVVVSGDIEPKRRKLTANAEVERAIGRHRDLVTLPSGTFPLIGVDWMQEIEGRYAEFVGQTFATCGLITDQRPIPAKAAMRLGAEQGRGAGCFKIERTASGVDKDGSPCSVPVFPTVFAPKGEHGKQLMNAHRERTPVTVLVHLRVSERNGLKGEDRWEGYISFEAGKPKPRSWAFVVDDVIAGDTRAAEKKVAKKKSKKPVPQSAPSDIQID